MKAAACDIIEALREVDPVAFSELLCTVRLLIYGDDLSEYEQNMARYLGSVDGGKHRGPISERLRLVMLFARVKIPRNQNPGTMSHRRV